MWRCVLRLDKEVHLLSHSLWRIKIRTLRHRFKDISIQTRINTSKN